MLSPNFLLVQNPSKNIFFKCILRIGESSGKCVLMVYLNTNRIIANGNKTVLWCYGAIYWLHVFIAILRSVRRFRGLFHHKIQAHHDSRLSPTSYSENKCTHEV